MDERLYNPAANNAAGVVDEDWYQTADAIFKARMADYQSYGQPGGYASYMQEARKYQSNLDPLETMGYLNNQRAIDSNWEYAQNLGKSLYNGGIGVVRDTLNGIRAARDYNIALLNEQAKAQGFERNPDQDFINALDNTAKADVLQPYEVKQSASRLGQFGLDVAQGAGQLAGQMAVSIPAEAIAPGIGGLAMMVGQITGGQYEDLKAKGVDTKRAAEAAFANAMIQAPFERLSLTRLMRRVPAGSVLKKKLKMVLEDMATEGITEAIQQFPEEWAELWALNPDKSWKELREMAAKKFPDTLQNALYAGLIGGVLGAGSRGIHIAVDRNIDLALRKELHDERSAAMESRINHIKQSGISPDYAGETVNANLNNATVLIDGGTLNAYAQRVGEEKAAEKLGVTVDDIREAAEKGDTVEVKQGNFEALSASDPSFYQEVKDDLSFDANDMSNRKYDTIQANIERYSKIGEKERTELKTEVDKIAATMEEAGVPKGQIAGMKAMLTSFATAMRPDNPAQFIRDNALRFERGVTKRAAFNQIAVNDAAYLEAVQQAEQTGDWTKVQQMVDEAAELAGMANGQEINIYVPDGTRADGTKVNFAEAILDGTKKGETRTHKNLTRKWVGVARDGKVIGRVRLGDPKLIDNKSPEYKDALIEDTEYDLKDGETKYYYPVEEVQDLRDNPREITQNGNYGKYQYKSNEPVTRDENGNIIPLSQRFNPNSGDFYRQEVSTRQPSAAGMPEELDPLFNLSFTDYETAKSHEASFKDNVEALRSIEGMDVPATDPYEAAEQMIERMVDNLLFLYNKVPENLRDRAKLWYDGGHATAVEWGKRYGIPPQAAAAVIAVLSPQKDWFQNLSLAERILDCVYGHMNERWTDEMTTVAEGYTTQVEELNKKTGKMEMVDKEIKPLADGEANQAAYKRAKGKTLKELVEVGDYHAAAVWVRCYDKTHNENRYKVVTPEGGTGDYQKATRKVEVIDEDAPPPKPGKNYKTKFIEVVVDDPLKWQGYGPVSKAISIAVNPSVANIFYNVGDRHKVRNFYNNLDSPGSNKYATIDTHAVAAALLQPLGSSSRAVNQNFGANEGAAGTNVTGIYGTYAFYFEAYRRAAERMGVLPREMQSIVWEVIRNMYPSTMKKSAEAKQLIADWKTTAEEIKKAAEEGEDTKHFIDEMQNKAYNLGTDEEGTLKPFAWENIPENAVIGDTYDRANVTIQKYDKREHGTGGSSFGVEVAPDPNNKELTDLWNKLKKENPLLAKQISDEVIGNTIKKVFHEFDIDFDQDTNLVSRLGGYLGATNPSYEVVVENPNLLLAISKMLGRALSQNSVMLVSSQPALGTTPHDIVSISLPDGWGDDEIDEFYKELYKIKAKDGGDLFTGHSSSDGVMTIVNTSDYPTQLLLDGIKSTAPNFSVDVTSGYCGFVSKDEYGFEDKDVPKPKPEEVVRIQIPEGWTEEQVNELAQKIGSMQNKRKKALSSGTSVADGVMTVEKGADVSIKALLDNIKETLPELTAKKEKKDAGSNTEFIPEKIDDRRTDLIKRESSEELESKLRAATRQNVSADATGSSQGNGPAADGTTDQRNQTIPGQTSEGTGNRVEFNQEADTLFDEPGQVLEQQKAQVRAQYEGTDQWMKAPNGQDTALTEDQWVTVRTPAFKNWFGDWENDPQNASKAVYWLTKEPLVVYHGTNADIEAFDTERGGEGTTRWGRGAYFATGKGTASEYANERTQGGGGNPTVGAYFLNTRNLFDNEMSRTPEEKSDAWKKLLEYLKQNNIDLQYIVENSRPGVAAGIAVRLFGSDNPDARRNEIRSGSWEANAKFRDLLQEFGFDGISANLQDGTEFVVFNQNQIKDATGRNVGFDPNTGNVYKQENAPATQTKGSFDPFTDGEAVIKLFEGADASTVIHETGHYYIESMWREIAAGRATEQQKADFEKLMKYCGITTEQWARMDTEGRRAAHERLAEAIETYVMEDKAPTRELRPVFKRFAKWLKAVYSAISRNQNAVPLTDEVREVFDRMLASEEDVEQMRRVEGYFEKLPSVITDNLSDATKKRIEDYILKAQDKAVEILTKERLANFSEDRKREIENYRNIISDEVRQEVANRPLYVAARQVQELLGGEKPASAKQYANLYLEEKLSDENEVKWEIVAEQNNMSPMELAQKLVEEPSETEAYKAAMNDAVRKEYPDYYTEREQAEAATREAMYNDESGILLGVEQVLIEDFAARAAAQQRSAETARKLAMAKRQQAKVAAQKELSNMKVKDATRVDRFIAAERRCAVKSAEAMAKKDYETARHYKDMQAFNHACVIESANLRKRKQQYDKLLQRLYRAKRETWTSEQHFNQAMALFARMGLMNPQYDPTTRTESLVEYVNTMSEMFYPFNEIPEWLADETWPITDPKNMKFEDYEKVVDLMRYIKTMAKVEKAANFFDSNSTYQEWRDQAIDNLNKLATKFAPVLGERQTAAWMDRFQAAFQTLDNFLEKMDGWHFGFFSRTFGDAIKHANDNEYNHVEAYQKRKAEIEQAWCPDDKTLAEKAQDVYYEELGASASKFVLTKMLMNLGNEGNARKLCSSYPSEALRGSSLWVFENGMLTKDEAIAQTKENLLEFLGRVLTKEDIAYAQAKIDLAGMYWGEMADLDRRTKGFTPKKVEAYPVMLTLANGEQIVFRGGYFPLIRNGEMGSHPVGVMPVSDTDPNQGRNVRTMHTDTGHMISRVEAEYPVDLTEGSEDRAMRAAVHDLCWRETMTDFRRILNDQFMFGLMKSKLGIADMQSFREMLEHAAQPNGSASMAMGEGLLATTAGWLRRKTVNSIVMLNLRINLQNFGNLFLYGNTVEGFGYSDVLGAIGNAFSNGFEGRSFFEMWDFVDRKSAFMRSRSETPDITLADLRDEGKLNKYEREAMKWGARAMMYTDGLTARPVWMQAYTKKMNAGATEQEAIDFADTIVRRTLGSGRVTDVSSLQRGGPVYKLFTAFQGFFNTQFNQWMREYNIDRRLWSEKEYKEMALRITSFVASKYLAACFFNLVFALQNPFADDDDDEYKNYTTELMHYPMSLVGIYGPVANFAMDKTLGIKAYSYRMSIIESSLDKVYRASGKMGKMIEGDFEAGLEGLTDVAGIAAGVPAQMNRLFWNAYDIFVNGMEPRLEDLATRRPKRERNK